MAGGTERRTSPFRSVLAWLEVALVVAVVGFWFLELRPQALGGPASYALVSGTSMLPRYHTGDVVIVHRHAGYHVGDIVAYRVPKGSAGAGAVVIHRIKGGNGRTGFVVQGDNRTAPDIWHPTTGQIVGSAWVHIAGAGVVVRLLHTPVILAALAAVLTMVAVLRRGSSPEPEAPAAVLSEPPAAAPPPPPRLPRMAALAGPPPAGAVLCSRGCHVLLPGARFDPHDGQPVEVDAVAAARAALSLATPR